MRKKLFSVFLTCVLTMGLLAGCGSGAGSNTSRNNSAGGAASNNSSNNVSNNAQQSGAASENTGNTTKETGKVLVVYYSAMGSTKAVAETIAESTNGDLFELVPKDDYTNADLDWTKNGSRVNIEHDDESKRDIELVADTVDNWESYSYVFIGYPIWWGIAAWPVNNFIKNNDFTGKTVIPFCTSASSGLGDSGVLLEKMAGTGDWQEGIRFRSSAASSDVQNWVSGLGILN